MSIRKEDLHLIVDLANDKDTKLVYDLMKIVIQKDLEKEIIVEADHSPLSRKRKKPMHHAKVSSSFIVSNY